jgi:ceramide glucosyltransferase
MNWADVWKHQVRWARTIRVCQPAPYFFSILSNATLWALLWLVVSLLTTRGASLPLTAMLLLLTRIALAQKLQFYFTPGRRLISDAWLVPLKDLLQTAVWFAAFAGNTVEWRGRRMQLLRDGTLIELRPTA